MESDFSTLRRYRKLLSAESARSRPYSRRSSRVLRSHDARPDPGRAKLGGTMGACSPLPERRKDRRLRPRSASRTPGNLAGRPQRSRKEKSDVRSLRFDPPVVRCLPVAAGGSRRFRSIPPGHHGKGRPQHGSVRLGGVAADAAPHALGGDGRAAPPEGGPGSSSPLQFSIDTNTCARKNAKVLFEASFTVSAQWKRSFMRSWR